MIASTIRDKYLKQSLPVRLGSLAADLARIASIAQIPATAAVSSLLEEAKAFIEWSAPELDTDRAARLGEIQLQLADWHYRWHQAQQVPAERDKLAEQAQKWSDEILEMSGLLETE